jgi:hypothetical protein
MQEYEYLLFFQDQGRFIVEVKFAKSNASISERHASPEDIARLLSMLDNPEALIMTFDEHPGEITKLMIDPIHRKIRLFVRLLDGDSV